MRIIDRKTFLAMPKGTVYAKIPHKWIVDKLCVKYESTDNDWYYMDFSWVDADDSTIAFDRLEEMDINSTVSYPVQNSIARDGLFDETDKFLIYEIEDINFVVAELEGQV